MITEESGKLKISGSTKSVEFNPFDKEGDMEVSINELGDETYIYLDWREVVAISDWLRKQLNKPAFNKINQ